MRLDERGVRGVIVRGLVDLEFDLVVAAGGHGDAEAARGAAGAAERQIQQDRADLELLAASCRARRSRSSVSTRLSSISRSTSCTWSMTSVLLPSVKVSGVPAVAMARRRHAAAEAGRVARLKFTCGSDGRASGRRCRQRARPRRKRQKQGLERRMDVSMKVGG